MSPQGETDAGGTDSGRRSHGSALVDWVETLLVYKLPRLSREEIRKMLNVLNVEYKTCKRE